MAILKDDQVLRLPERWQDKSKFSIADESEYTSTVGDRRLDAARIMLAAKMDENQKLAFITGLDNSDPLNTLEWEITSQGDGAYRFFYFNILFYNVATTYQWEVQNSEGVITQYRDVIYKNGTYYTPKVATVIAVEPEVTADWADSWEEYDITDLENQLLSTRLDIHIHDDIFTANYEDCILEEVDEKNDDVLCGICVSNDAVLKIFDMEFLLNAANSFNWQDKATKSEIILREALKRYCSTC